MEVLKITQLHHAEKREVENIVTLPFLKTFIQLTSSIIFLRKKYDALLRLKVIVLGSS